MTGSKPSYNCKTSQRIKVNRVHFSQAIYITTVIEMIKSPSDIPFLSKIAKALESVLLNSQLTWNTVHRYVASGKNRQLLR